jgi:hypothetical protein
MSGQAELRPKGDLKPGAKASNNAVEAYGQIQMLHHGHHRFRLYGDPLFVSAKRGEKPLLLVSALRVPSLRRCSGGRTDGPSLALRR